MIISKPYTYSEMAKKKVKLFFKCNQNQIKRGNLSFLKSGTFILHAFVPTRVARKEKNTIFLRL